MSTKIYARPDSPYWYAEITTPDGTIRRVSTGVSCSPGNKRKAGAAAAEKEQEFLADNKRQASLSLTQAWVLFATDNHRVRASTRNYYAIQIAKVIEETNNAPLSDLTLGFLRAYIKTRREAKVSDSQVHRELVVLSSVIEFAILQDMAGVPATNPMRLLPRRILSRSAPKTRWQPPDMVRALYEQMPMGFWKDFFTLVLGTGMRREEALGLRWDEVNFKEQAIRLGADREKTKRGRIIPLTTGLYEILHRLRTVRLPNAEHVFVNPRTRVRYVSINKAWRLLTIKAGFPEARIHDLRHTFASYTRQSGMSKDDRKDIVGHSSDSAHEGYSRSSVTSLRRALESNNPLDVLTGKTQEL